MPIDQRLDQDNQVPAGPGNPAAMVQVDLRLGQAGPISVPFFPIDRARAATFDRRDRVAGIAPRLCLDKSEGETGPIGPGPAARSDRPFHLNAPPPAPHQANAQAPAIDQVGPVAATAIDPDVPARVATCPTVLALVPVIDPSPCQAKSAAIARELDPIVREIDPEIVPGIDPEIAQVTSAETDQAGPTAR